VQAAREYVDWKRDPQGLERNQQKWALNREAQPVISAVAAPDEIRPDFPLSRLVWPAILA